MSVFSVLFNFDLWEVSSFGGASQQVRMYDLKENEGGRDTTTSRVGKRKCFRVFRINVNYILEVF